jgi:hypothetical protein
VGRVPTTMETAVPKASVVPAGGFWLRTWPMLLQVLSGEEATVMPATTAGESCSVREVPLAALPLKLAPPHQQRAVVADGGAVLKASLTPPGPAAQLADAGRPPA